MKQFYNVLKICTILVLSLTYIGCDEDEEILPEIEAGFTHTINEDIGTVRFINTSLNADSFSWDFGDGTSSTEINPVKTYDSGTYTIVMTAKNVSGATAMFEDVITITIPEIIQFPITFDNTLINYSVTTTFGGTSFEVVENPDLSGDNPTASNVGSITNSGAAFEGIYFDLGEDLNLSDEKSVSMKFWSQTPVSLLLKLEEGTSGAIETSANHRGSGWETVIFNFDSSASYSRLTFFVDGPGSTSGTFYIDDIFQIETPIPPSFPYTFEDGVNYFTAFEGATVAVIDNPDSDGNDSDKVLELVKPTGVPFYAGIYADPTLNAPVIDMANGQLITMKVWSPKADIRVRVRLEQEPGVTEPPAYEIFQTIANANEWTTLSFDFSSTAATDTAIYTRLVINTDWDTDPAAGETFYIDDISQAESSGNGGGGTNFDSGLLTNGDFENGSDSWTIGVGTDPAPTVTNDGNTYYSVNVETAGNAYDVNLTQKIEITQGSTYTLTFDAWSDRSRSIVAGIGLSGGDFANTTDNVSITTQRTTYTLTLTATEFGAADARVLFDSGAEVGIVNIDNVSLVLADTGGGSGGAFDDGLLTNGDFESGAEPWTIGVGTDPAPIVQEDGNTYYSVNVEVAGNAYDVNLTQKIEIIQGSIYTLTFDAWSDRSRSILAGIGLSGGDFTNDTENVAITTERTTYTLTLSSAEFGATDARVLFDNGAEVGIVNIDNVALTLASSGGGNSGGGTGGTGGDGSNFLTNGDFETGDTTGWLFFDNGGVTSISDTENNGGSFSGKITTAPQKNPGIKQERFGVGTITANQNLTVTLDSKIESLVDGAIVNVLAFSESATDGVEAVLHNLGTINTTAGTWNTNTFNFTTAGDVSGGVSLLIEVVCGGATTCAGTVYFDNVSVVAN